MDWREEYKRKLTTFEEAAKQVKSGDVVAMGFGPAAPSAELYEAILNRWEELQNVSIVDALQVRKTRLYDPEFMAKLDGHVLFAPGFGWGAVRPIYKEKRFDFFGGCATNSNPERYSNITDVFCQMVTPPNEHGYVNMGISSFYGMGIARRGRAIGKLRTMIAEVNDQLPTVYGDNWIHVSQIDYFVEKSAPIVTFARPVPGEREKTIAGYVGDLIEDRCTIQMGFGSIPEAIIPMLEHKKDLGVLTEMFPSGLPDLVEKGVITNKYKPYHKGVTVASFCLGDKAMYDFIDRNPLCELHPIDYTNNPAFIGAHPKMRTINMAIMVDLNGQIASESIGHRLVSGPGGQPDFQVGAFLSDGGFPITVLTSSRKLKDGTLSSSIVPTFPPGTVVTVPRTFAYKIVTEFGVADLRDKSSRQRAEALINIAHPDLREELRAQARKLLYP